MFESVTFLFSFILVVTIVNVAVLALIHTILKRIPFKAAGIVIPLLVVLANYLVLMKANAANLIIGSHLVIIPMAVLIAAVLNPAPDGSDTGFTPLLLCDFFVTITAVVILGFVAMSGALSTVQYYANLPVSNAVTTTCIFIAEIVLAAILFDLMRRRRRYPAKAAGKGT